MFLIHSCVYSGRVVELSSGKYIPKSPLKKLTYENQLICFERVCIRYLTVYNFIYGHYFNCLDHMTT